MNTKLTYLLFLSFVGCLAASCTSDAPEHEDVSKGSEMSFEVSGLSRAVTTSFNEFALYGDLKNLADENNYSPIAIFENTEVRYDGTAWTYDKTQYWIPGCDHSFVAVNPLSVLNAANNPSYSNSQLSFTYTIPTTSGALNKDDVADIITATHRRLFQKTDIDNTVTLKFSHIMAKINIAPALNDNVMSPDGFIGIHKLELSGFNTKASFSILPASRQSNDRTDDRIVEISRQEGEGSLTIDFTEPFKVLNNRDNVSIFDDKDAIIMIPQTFAADSEAKIILSYTVNDNPEMKHITLPLMTQKWESGKSYAYRFTLDRTGLLFDSTAITDWDQMNVGNIDAH